ncbi:MAG: hypothetical protein J6I66_10040 [Lachnospiraceae bacterium]|nr:hypothetical protein [Lachnospiraceae bacterium]
MKIIRNLVIAMASALMVIGVSALKVQAAPVKMADGTMFDAAYYASAYPDVAAVFGTNPDLLYMHYQLCGKAEGRLAVAPSSAAPALATGTTSSADFDAAYYAKKYPDVAQILGYDPAVLKLHYDLYGKAEGRFPNAAAENAAGAASVTAPVAPSAATPTTGVTISSLGSRYAAVSADMMLNGSGTGYHAKISLMNGIGSAVSFGIQYDLFGAKPYNGKTVYICENVVNNLPGGQVYTRHGFANLGVPTNIMIVLDTQTGMIDLYVNGTLVGQVANTNLLQGQLSACVEGAARIDGDTVIANFSNVRFKKPGTTNTTGDRVFFWQTQNTNAGIATSYSGSAPGGYCTSSNITVQGTIVGLGIFDWDSAYANVSGMGVYALWL